MKNSENELKFLTYAIRVYRNLRLRTNYLVISLRFQMICLDTLVYCFSAYNAFTLFLPNYQLVFIEHEYLVLFCPRTMINLS